MKLNTHPNAFVHVQYIYTYVYSFRNIFPLNDSPIKNIDQYLDKFYYMLYSCPCNILCHVLKLLSISLLCLILLLFSCIFLIFKKENLGLQDCNCQAMFPFRRGVNSWTRVSRQQCPRSQMITLISTG